MPAYHSKVDAAGAQEACGCTLLPLKTKSRGPAPVAPDDAEDIVDEVLKYFRPNCLFRNFDARRRRGTIFGRDGRGPVAARRGRSVDGSRRRRGCHMDIP